MDLSGWVKWDFIVVVVMKPHYTAVALLQFTTTPEVHDRQERVTRTQLHITNEAENQSGKAYDLRNFKESFTKGKRKAIW